MLNRVPILRRSTRCAVAVVVLAAFVVAVSPNLEAEATFPGINGKIAFVTWNADNASYEIWTMDTDGSNQTALTDDPADDTDPTWSPDGSTIAFASGRDPAGIYVMAADGGKVTPLTLSGDGGWGPVWSPDGSKLAFTSSRAGTASIYVVDANGTGERAVTGSAGDDHDPAWSPDGSRIAFTSTRGGDLDVYVVRSDGTGMRALADTPAWDRRPSWSPDGSTIAFTSSRDGTDDIYVVAAEGGEPTQLSFAAYPAEFHSPTWSPDGTKIAFVALRGSSSSIATMHADGSNTLFVPRQSLFDIDPAWSPDSMRIAFAAREEVASHIYVVDADGSNATRLTSGTSFEFHESPDWQPVLPPGAETLIGALIEDIQALVADGVIRPGPANSLWRHLRNALRSLERGHVGPACRQIQGFIHDVSARVEKALPPEAAARWVSVAEDARHALSCEP